VSRLVPAPLDALPERDVLCHAEWGQRLTVPQFLQREARLRAHPWARDAMTTWLWRVESGEVLSSCESYRMSSLLDGAPGETFGVAGVFTEPSLRGRGHAGRMMQALVSRWRDSEPRAHAAILFSDVGPALYERAGFRAVPAQDRVFLPEPGDPAEGVDALFNEAGVPAELARTPLPPARFGVWPSAAQLDWHLERERLYAELLGGRRPLAAGARVDEGRVFWAGDLKVGHLEVLLLSARTRAQGTLLLRAARRVAHAAGLSEVVLWEVPVPFTWPPGPDGGTPQRRSGELPMLAPLTAPVDAGAWTVVPRALWL
jgi:GNAT superfamily N-acetyltransferase